jgi:hypothetical protein
MYLRVKVRRVVCRAAAVFALLLLAGVSSAGEVYIDQSSQPGWTDGWVPSFAVSGTFYAQQQASALESECQFGGPLAEPVARCSQGEAPTLVGSIQPKPRDARLGVPTLHAGGPFVLRDPAAASDLTVWPALGLNFQLMSPNLLYRRGPRLFFGAEITATFPPQRSIANEGALSMLEFPRDAPDPSTFPAQGFSGLGANVLSEPRTFHYGAQVGVAIPFSFLNRTLRIKPSFAWLHYQIDVKGNLLTAIKDDVNGVTFGILSSFGPNLRTIDLTASETRDVDAVGPGLEIELDSIRSGPFGASMFTSVHIYRVVTDRKIRLTDEVSFPDGTGSGGDGLLADTYRARWSHDLDPWIYRLRVGIRFHYFGD